MTSPFASICIPSYNRPDELTRLLRSIPRDCANDLEVLVAEDHAPRRTDVRRAVERFISESSIVVRYIENDKNLGFDANLRRLAESASGEYIIYMGDDDIFDSENLPAFLAFLKQHPSCGYVLKTHTYIHRDGSIEPFKYFPTDRFFAAGVEAFRSLFRRSVFISGFCFKREFAIPFHTDRFDGTLLYQLYLLAEIVLRHPSAYCSIPITVQGAQMRGVPLFGSSESESKLYTPGSVTPQNSVNFIKSYMKIARDLDRMHGIGAEVSLQYEISKYSYPVIAIQRWRGLGEFRTYCKTLEDEVRINRSYYYYIYYYALVFFGPRVCDRIICLIKRVVGSTPRL